MDPPLEGFGTFRLARQVGMKAPFNAYDDREKSVFIGMHVLNDACQETGARHRAC